MATPWRSPGCGAGGAVQAGMDLAGMKRRELQALCKRHGLPAGGANVDLVARLDAALSGAAGAEEEVAGVAATKGCLKQLGGDAAEAKKVTFAAEEGKGRRLRSRVTWSPIVSRTRGKSAQASADSAAEDDSISAEACTDVPMRRSRRNSVSAAEAEVVGEAVAVDRKRKRKNQENDESVAVSAAQVGVSSRVTRRQSLAGAAVVLPPVVEKKRGRGKAAGGSSKLAAQGQDCELDAQNSAQVEVSARITRSRATAPVVMSSTVVENKRRRKTGGARANVELPTVSDVPRNDAPVTRSLRNRTVQVNNCMVDETHPARQLENKTQPSKPPTRRHQQVSSSVEDKNQEQIAAPSKAPLLRRSGRNCSEDAEKQPAVKRSTRKSVVLDTLEKEENGPIEVKNPEPHVRRSMRKSVVPVKDIKGIAEKIQNSSSEDAAKKPATKGPVRGSRRKSIVSDLHDKGKGFIAEKNMEVREGKSMRKAVMPVKDIKAVGEGIQNAKGKDVQKQFVVKQPTRRSSRKSILPDILNVRRSTRKSVLPNMLNEENQDHSKLDRKENFQIGKCQDDERQQKVKEPIRRSRRSVAAVAFEEQSNGLQEEKMSKNPMRRSTRKSVSLNEVEKMSIDHTEIVPQEVERVGEEGLKLRKHRRSSLEISSSANDSWRKQQDTQLPNEKANTGGTQQASNSTTSKGRSSKRRRTTASEEVMSVKEATDDIIIMEATMDAHKATHEYKESSSRVQEFGQIIATREELSSGPLLATVTPTDKISAAKSVPMVIPGSESGDNANESSDKSKQDHSDIQAVDTHLCEASGELDQSSCIAGLVPYNCVVSEVNASMSKGSEAALLISESDTSPEIYCNAVAEESVRAADLEECPSRRSIGNPLSKSLHLEDADDTSLPVPNADKGCSSDGRSSSFGLELIFAEECIESYSRNTENTAVEIDGGNKPSTTVTPGFYMRSDENVQPTNFDADRKLDVDESVAEEFLAQEKSNDQHVPTKTDLNIKLNDELAGPCTESGSSISENNTGLVSDNIDEQAIIMVQQGDVQEGDLENLSLRSATDLTEEIGGGNKPSTPVKPDSYVECGCSEDEDLQPTKCDADKKLNVDQGVAEEDLEKSSNQHVPAKTDLNMMLNDELAGSVMESGCSITEKSARLDANNINEQAMILVQQGDVQEGDLEKLSLCSATPLPEENCGGIKPSTPVKPDSCVGSECVKDEDVQPTKCDADKKLDVDQGVVEEKVLDQEKSSNQHVPAKTDLNMMLNDELAGPDARLVGNNIDEQAMILVQLGDVQEATPLAEEIGGGNKPRTLITPGFSLGSDCLEDEDVQPGFDGDKKLDVDQGVTAEEVSAQQKSNAQHVPTKTDLNIKLNDEIAGPCMESGCSITEKNARLFADNLDQQAIFQVQPGDVQEGDLKKPSPCSKTPDCKHKCGLPEGTALPPKNTGSISSAEQSPIGLESLFSQENIDESMGSATAHTKNGFDDSKDCHVKSAIENTHVSEPYSHDDSEECIFKNDVCMQTSQQDNRMQGFPEPNLDEERVLSVFSLDTKHLKEVINFEEVACEGEGSKKLVHSEELKASSEKTNVNGPDNNEYGITDAVLSSALHTPANDNYEICLGSNTDMLHQVHNDQCSDDTDIIVDASAKYIERGIVLLSGKERSNLKDGQLNSKLEGAKVVESGLYFNKDIGNILDSGSVVGEVTPSGSGLSKDSSKEYGQEVLDGLSLETSLDGSTCGENIVCRVDAIENPSISLATSGYKHEGALAEEATCTMKNYGGTCSSNPREVLMELQSLFSKGNTKESPHDGLAFRSAENSGDESINVEQRDNLHDISDLSHLDELIGCSNTVVVCQGDNHKATEPCTNDIVKAAASAKCIESGLVLPSSEERSNLNDGQLNPKLESPNIMVSGLNCDKDVRNTSDNGSFVVVLGERTPSGSGLPEDYPKDHYPRQEFVDSFSVESSLQDTIFGKAIVSGVAGIGNPSSSLATPDPVYKNDSALSEEAVCRMKNCTGTSSVDPRHLLMDLQSLSSEGSAEKSDPDYKNDSALSEEAVCRMKNCTGTSSVDPRHLLMDLQSLSSEGSAEKSDLQDNLAFRSAESGRDEHIICHVEKLVDTHVSSEPGPCQDLSRHEEKESSMSVPMQVKESGGFLRSSHRIGSLTSVPIDLVDDAHLIERDIVATVEVLCEEKVERKSVPTSESDILQEKPYSSGHGICQSRSQKHIGEANSRLLNCTEVLDQDHKECNKSNEHKFSPKTLVENNMTEDTPMEGIGSSMMVPLVAGMSERPDEQLNTKMSDESEELSFSYDKDTIENFCTGPANRDLYPLPKDFHIDSCQKQKVPEVLSSPKSPEECTNFQCVSVSGSGPCQQRLNESTSLQVSYNIETLNQDHEEYSQNNEDQNTPGIQSSCVPEAVEIQQSEIAAESSVLLVPDKQLNNKLEGKKVEVNCSYDKNFSSLFDTDFVNKEASSLQKDDCMDLPCVDNHPNDLPAPRSPEQPAYFQNNDSDSVAGSCQRSRRRGIDELRAKLQSFKVSSTVKGSYIAMSAPRPKPVDSMSQSAIELLRNRENISTVKAGHPTKPNADVKDSSRRALQPISGRPREH